MTHFSSYHIKAQPEQRVPVDLPIKKTGLQYIGFRALRLAAGECEVFESATLEHCITVLQGGAVSISVGDLHCANLRGRDSVFAASAPHAVYAPPKHKITITAHEACELGISSAPAKGLHRARYLDPAMMTQSVRGAGSNARYICDILPETQIAESLLVVEVRTPAGHSSSYPPHKHDSSSAQETALEEIYYHRLNPAQGFAFQRVYTDDRSIDQAMAVENHDCVLVPRGYHPCAAVHGYDLYYLNTMAGPVRHWAFNNDPQHDWLIKK